MPFRTVQSHGPLPNSGSVPMILHSVIDLVFREANGWVVVDYKTDARGDSELPPLVEHYRPQVEAYCNFWQSAVGEPVVDKGPVFHSYGQICPTRLTRYQCLGRNPGNGKRGRSSGTSGFADHRRSCPTAAQRRNSSSRGHQPTGCGPALGSSSSPERAILNAVPDAADCAAFVRELVSDSVG